MCILIFRFWFWTPSVYLPGNSNSLCLWWLQHMSIYLWYPSIHELELNCPLLECGLDLATCFHKWNIATCDFWEEVYIVRCDPFHLAYFEISFFRKSSCYIFTDNVSEHIPWLSKIVLYVLYSFSLLVWFPICVYDN